MNTKIFSEIEKHNIASFVFYFLIIAILGTFTIISWVVPGDRKIFTEDMSVYQGVFERVYEDGTKETVTLPQKFNVEAGETLVLSTVLPEYVEENTYLCYRSSHQYVKMYIDGELSAEYDTSGEALYGNNAASRFLFYRMHEEYAGKTLTLEITSNSSYAGKVETIYYGESLGIWAYLIDYYGMSLAMGYMLGVVSGISLVLCLALSLIYKRHNKLAYLVWAVFWYSCWIICESKVRQLLFVNNSLTAVFAFLCIPMLVFSVVLYIDLVQGKRYRLHYALPYFLNILAMIITLVLHLTKKADLLQTMYYNYATSFYIAAMAVIAIVRDIKIKKVRSYYQVAIGFGFLTLFAIVEVIAAVYKNTRITGIPLGIGILIFFCSGAYYTSIQKYKEDQEKQRAQVINESKDMFLASMSHEIRTPINSILGMNQLIIRENKDPQIAEYAQNIERAGTMLLGLVNDILDFSKIGSNKFVLIRNEYSTATVIKDLSILITDRAKDKGLKFMVEADESLPKRLAGDHMRIKQVVTNILTNAVKYTKEGSVTLSVSFTQQKENEINLIICVSDTGQGIKTENIDKIFSAFTRVEERKNQSIEGTGLGLAITKQLVELMGGTIDVESEFGKGSKFTVIIPQEIVDPSPMGDVQTEGRKEITQSKEYRCLFTAPEAKVLAVDDNAVNLAVVKGLLKTSEVKISTAKSGGMAIELCRKEDFDLILMDHMMPEKDGIETFHELQDLWKNNSKASVPTIALTANAIAGMKEMYLEEGFSDYLSKPIDCDALEKMLFKYLPQEKVTILE